MINNTILSILLILFCNVFKTLKWKYILNLTSSGKTSETVLQLDSPCICQHKSLYAWLFLSVRPVDQQRRQLAVRFYSKWYYATSGVDVLARRLRLASNTYIVCESANKKVCQYQVMISNGLFEETNEQHIFYFFLKYFAINYVLNFLYIIFNEKSLN